MHQANQLQNHESDTEKVEYTLAMVDNWRFSESQHHAVPLDYSQKGSRHQ